MHYVHSAILYYIDYLHVPTHFRYVLMNFRLSSMSFTACRNDLCHINPLKHLVLKLVMFYIHYSPDWQRLAQDPSCSRQHHTWLVTWGCDLKFGFLPFMYSISVTNKLTGLTWSCLVCFSVFPLLGCKESFVTNQEPNLPSKSLHSFTENILWSKATHTYLFYTELYLHDIQVYLKFLNKLQEWVLYTKTKQISFKHMFGNVWLLSWNKRVHSTVNTLPTYLQMR